MNQDRERETEKRSQIANSPTKMEPKNMWQVAEVKTAPGILVKNGIIPKYRSGALGIPRNVIFGRFYIFVCK
jgi:hypothetical protein